MAAADTGTEEGAADAGEALRARIMAQVEQQQGQAQSKAQAAALAAAEKEAAEAAAKAEKEAKEKAEAARKKAEEEAAKKAEAERLAELAKQYALPTSSYTITSTFGEAGAYWSSGHHTGLDFAAPTGTLIKAVHTGTITSAAGTARTATRPCSPSTTAPRSGTPTSRRSTSASARRSTPGT